MLEKIIKELTETYTNDSITELLKNNELHICYDKDTNEIHLYYTE